LAANAFSLFLWVVAAVQVVSAQAVPVFTAMGTISCEKSAGGRVEPAVFAFQSSNAWWRVEAQTRESGGFHTITENTMSIPGGVRSYFLFEPTKAGAMTLATAYAWKFPPPGQLQTFIPWLALCPRAQLPVIEGNRLRRFLNIPCYQPNFLDDERNVGTFVARNLAPANAFLAELSITNNGVWLDGNVGASGGLELQSLSYAARFNHPSLEMRYQVLATANVSGVAFPRHAVFTTYLPDWERQDKTAVRESMVYSLLVTQINLSITNAPWQKHPPETMIADDERQPDPSGITRQSYLLTNDQWSAVSPYAPRRGTDQ
jgi:hypothetical protein